MNRSISLTVSVFLNRVFLEKMVRLDLPDPLALL